uniref:Uncharacterized protein n=1 Tax=Romanomermis culicivorax TaxID=13658 RepID=A0A915J1E1_ROMCU
MTSEKTMPSKAPLTLCRCMLQSPCAREIMDHKSRSQKDKFFILIMIIYNILPEEIIIIFQ